MFKCLWGNPRLSGTSLKCRYNLPDFRVTHKTIVEANGQTMGSQLAETVVLGNRVHVFGIRGVDRIALLLLGNAPAIVNAGCRKTYQKKIDMNSKVPILT